MCFRRPDATKACDVAPPLHVGLRAAHLLRRCTPGRSRNLHCIPLCEGHRARCPCACSPCAQAQAGAGPPHTRERHPTIARAQTSAGSDRGLQSRRIASTLVCSGLACACGRGAVRTASSASVAAIVSDPGRARSPARSCTPYQLGFKGLQRVYAARVCACWQSPPPMCSFEHSRHAAAGARASRYTSPEPSMPLCAGGRVPTRRGVRARACCVHSTRNRCDRQDLASR